jgi:hypothetical protein
MADNDGMAFDGRDELDDGCPGMDEGCPDAALRCVPQRHGKRADDGTYPDSVPRSVREQIAAVSARLPHANGTPNNEEGTYAEYCYQANYSKALRKTDTGLRSDPEPTAYRKYLAILRAARIGTGSDFESIPIGGCEEVVDCKCEPRMQPRRLTNPQGGLPFVLAGPDPSGVNLNLLRVDPKSLRPAPRIDAQAAGGGTLAHENASEMVELYWMALVRDLPFRRWTLPTTADRVLPNPPPDWHTLESAANPLIDRAAQDLDALKANFAEAYPPGGGPVTPANVFRGATYGDRFGPYISQFLLRGNTTRCRRGEEIRTLPEDGVIPEGSVPNLQAQVTIEPYIDYMRTECEWRCVEQGFTDPSGTDANECGGNRFIRDLRDLAQWVHLDDPAQHFRNAALLLMNEPPLESSPARLGTLSRNNVGQLPLDASGTLEPLGDERSTCAPTGRPFPFPVCNPYQPGPRDLPCREDIRRRNPDSRNQVGFTTFGAPFVLNLIAEVAELALKAAWWQKWYVHRRARPEEVAGLVHYQRYAVDEGEEGPYPCVDPLILNHPVLNLIFHRNTFCDPVSGYGFVPGAKTYFLPQVFPEGSPTHPSYPSGHATISGACATLLKALFEESSVMTCPENTIPTDPRRLPVAFVATDTGRELEKAADQTVLTVGGELDKLASNISVGRNAAGVHWRSDATQGMALGEAVTTEFLVELALTLEEDAFCFTFRRFFVNERITLTRSTDHATRTRTVKATATSLDPVGPVVDLGSWSITLPPLPVDCP